jgi:hypothetical protein
MRRLCMIWPSRHWEILSVSPRDLADRNRQRHRATPRLYRFEPFGTRKVRPFPPAGERVKSTRKLPFN